MDEQEKETRIGWQEDRAQSVIIHRRQTATSSSFFGVEIRRKISGNTDFRDFLSHR